MTRKKPRGQKQSNRSGAAVSVPAGPPPYPDRIWSWLGMTQGQTILTLIAAFVVGLATPRVISWPVSAVILAAAVLIPPMAVGVAARHRVARRPVFFAAAVNAALVLVITAKWRAEAGAFALLLSATAYAAGMNATRDRERKKS